MSNNNNGSAQPQPKVERMQNSLEWELLHHGGPNVIQEMVTGELREFHLEESVELVLNMETNDRGIDLRIDNFYMPSPTAPSSSMPLSSESSAPQSATLRSVDTSDIDQRFPGLSDPSLSRVNSVDSDFDKETDHPTTPPRGLFSNVIEDKIEYTPEHDVFDYSAQKTKSCRDVAKTKSRLPSSSSSPQPPLPLFHESRIVHVEVPYTPEHTPYTWSDDEDDEDGDGGHGHHEEPKTPRVGPHGGGRNSNK